MTQKGRHLVHARNGNKCFIKMLDSSLKNLLQDQRIILFVSSFSLIGFLLLVFLKSSFTTIDINVNSWSVSIHVSLFTQVAKIIAYGFDTPVLLAISLLIGAYLFYKSYRKNSVLLMGAMAGNAVILAVVKTLVHSARPLNELMSNEGFSFPSGHTAGCIVFCGLLTYFGWQHWKSSKAKVSSSMIFVAIASVVGFSRIYLNAHWVSDVLGGYLLGVFWLTFSILAFQYSERAHPRKRTCHLTCGPRPYPNDWSKCS
jgi:undecaprenyl-diphosphatase